MRLVAVRSDGNGGCRDISEFGAHAGLERALPPVGHDDHAGLARYEIVQKWARGVGIGRSHGGVRKAVFHELLIEREGLFGRRAVELRLAVGDQLAAIGREQRRKRMNDARRPRIDQAEALLAVGLVGERLGVGQELGPVGRGALMPAASNIVLL